MTFYRDDRVTLYHCDALDVLRDLPDCSVDSVVTDPPYNLGFMGKDWDSFGGRSMNDVTRQRQLSSGAGWTAKPYGASGKPAAPAPGEQAAFQQWCEQWAAECLRVLKPGGHLLAFGGTRTWHRLACAVEDAGFEVRDSIAWLYGSGFPKSLDVSKAIDKAAGAERVLTRPGIVQRGGLGEDWDTGSSESRPRYDEPATDAAREWAGWGTALKPAFEPVVVARKPLAGTVAANVLTHGTGALNIDGCRIGTDEKIQTAAGSTPGAWIGPVVAGEYEHGTGREYRTGGRWPANVVLDEDMAGVLDEQGFRKQQEDVGYGGQGGASRFFYVAKAPKRERPVVDGVAHPTVKPLALMRWLVRLVTPPGGTVLEPFAGSGTTVEACVLEGFHCIAVEKGEEYLPLILERIRRQSEPVEPVRRVDVAKAIAEQVAEQLDIFGEETA